MLPRSRASSSESMLPGKLSHDVNIEQHVMILIFGDRWQEEVRRYASR